MPPRKARQPAAKASSFNAAVNSGSSGRGGARASEPEFTQGLFISADYPTISYIKRFAKTHGVPILQDCGGSLVVAKGCEVGRGSLGSPHRRWGPPPEVGGREWFRENARVSAHICFWF